jgi:hypothetical protein
MLEAAFVAWLVALLGDQTLRGVTRVLLGNRDRRAFESALSAAMTVTIAAVLQDVPPASRDALERALRERFAEPPASVLDGRTRVRTALIDAVQDQIGPLADPSITPSGRSFLEEIGVDAGQLRDDLAQVAIRGIEQVGPGFPALTPLVTQLNADGIVELGEAVGAKVDNILASIEQWKQAPPVRNRPSVRNERQPFEFPADVTDRIADALLAIPSISDRDAQNVIISMLPNPLRDSIPRSTVPRIQVYNIVRTCPHFAHGLRDLIQAIRSIESDSLPMRQLDNTILQIGEADEGEPSADWTGAGRPT